MARPPGPAEGRPEDMLDIRATQPPRVRVANESYVRLGGPRARAMTILIGLHLALTIAGAAGAGEVKARRVMSLNLCADQLVLMLVPPSRITSVSFLSRASEKPLLTAEGAGVKINDGTLEEVLAQKPDLVIAGIASTPTTREFLKRAAIPLIEVPVATNFDEIRNTTRLVARAVGEEAKADALIAVMDATLVELRAARPSRRIVVADWGGGGEVSGKGTLFDTILSAAGGVNLADSMRDRKFGSFDFEQLLALNPDIIAFGDGSTEKPGLRREQIQHRIVQRVYRNRQITYPESLYSCGLPQSAEAAKSLRRAMLEIVERSGR
jgi:iron complex transport system substrate-binding protein